MSRPITAAPFNPRKVKAREVHLIAPDLREIVKSRGDLRCELCGGWLGPNWECHHRQLRSRGGEDIVENLVALCYGCHQGVHRKPRWSQEHGWMCGANDNPATTPVALLGERWVLLTGDGRYLDAGDAA